MMRIDLENLAAGYAHRPSSPAALARARLAATTVGLSRGEVGLDIGGGQGQHAATWLDLGATPIVVDPSPGMARVSQRQQGVRTIRAYSQHLPFHDDTVRLAYFHLSLHYGDWKAALDEVGRVTMSDGECWIWTMGEQHHRSSFLTRWFPSVGDIDTARFPDPAQVAGQLDGICRQVEIERETEVRVMSASQWREAVEARFVSTLQLVSADEFRNGLVAYDAAYPDPDEPLEYALTFDRLRGVF